MRTELSTIEKEAETSDHTTSRQAKKPVATGYPEEALKKPGGVGSAVLGRRIRVLRIKLTRVGDEGKQGSEGRKKYFFAFLFRILRAIYPVDTRYGGLFFIIALNMDYRAASKDLTA